MPPSRGQRYGAGRARAGGAGNTGASGAHADADERGRRGSNISALAFAGAFVVRPAAASAAGVADCAGRGRACRLAGQHQGAGWR